MIAINSTVTVTSTANATPVNNAGTSQSDSLNPASPSGTFTQVLNNEINAKNQNTPPASTSQSSNTGNSANSATGKTDTAPANTTKKNTPNNKSDTQDSNAANQGAITNTLNTGTPTDTNAAAAAAAAALLSTTTAQPAPLLHLNTTGIKSAALAGLTTAANAAKTPAQLAGQTATLQAAALSNAAATAKAATESPEQQIQTEADTGTLSGALSADTATLADKTLAALVSASSTTSKSSASNTTGAEQLSSMTPMLTSISNTMNNNVNTDKLTPNVGTPAWDQALGQKVTWMTAGGLQNATLTLNPPDLGPLQVVLSVSNSHAVAAFTAHQPEVRQALENAIPKLREMLGQAGIQLGECSVGSQQQRQQEQSSGQSASNRSMTSIPGIAGAIGPGQTTSIRQGTGLVDTFV